MLSSKTCERVEGELSGIILVIRRVFVKAMPFHQILFNSFIYDICNNCDKYGISFGDKNAVVEVP